MSAELLVRAAALPGVLEGWCGPVVFALDPPVSAVLLGHETGGAYLGAPPPLSWRIAYDNGPAVVVPTRDIALDLARDEAADRVARWLAGAVGLAVGATGPIWTREPFPARPYAVMYSLTASVHSESWDEHALVEEARCFVDRQNPILPAGAIPVVATLAALDPADPRTLPSGARFVDRLALKLCAEHVGGSRGR